MNFPTSVEVKHPHSKPESRQYVILSVIYGTQVKERHMRISRGYTHLKNAETYRSEFSGSANGYD